MDNTFVELIKAVNPIQTVIFIFSGIIFYFKLKNSYTQQINGLGNRLDKKIDNFSNSINNVFL